jgi:hypothetical protein
VYPTGNARFHSVTAGMEGIGDESRPMAGKYTTPRPRGAVLSALGAGFLGGWIIRRQLRQKATDKRRG